MKVKVKPEEIWSEYTKGIEYNTSIDLYDNVETNQNFYNGKQWEGVNAPDIEKPVINICKTAIDYFDAMIISDDIAVNCELPDGLDELVKQAVNHITTTGIEQVFEQTRFKQLTRWFVKDCGINGDAMFHWWYNTLKNTKGKYIGRIDLELIDNTNFIFGNPAQKEVERQPYILIIAKLPIDEVVDMVDDSLKDEIVSDSDDYRNALNESEAKSVGKYATVITKFWKQDGFVYMTKTTQKVTLVKPINLKQTLYPVAKMSWKNVMNSYHGISPLTEIRQNQIMINKFYMMLNEFIKKLAFPKMLYDKTKIRQWTNKIEAVGVNGDPREAVFSSSPVMQLSEQVIGFIENLFEKTKSALGIYDVALGNVKAENTSAIIALQKTASQPLEMQKLDYFQVVEDSVRIIVDIMSAFYGIRDVPIKTDEGDGTIPFDYSDISFDDFGMNVEIGASAYWSEVTQIQTLDNMYRNGILMNDPVLYLEQLPNGVVKNRMDIIKAIKEKQAQAQMAEMAMLGQQQAQQMQAPAPKTKTISQPTNTVGNMPVRSVGK